MRTRPVIKIFTATLALILLTALPPTQAYLINGLLDDWGVLPHAQWSPAGGHVCWVEEDNWGSAHAGFPSGGEQYDAEAMYGDIAGGMVYIALVTSFPATGIYSALPGDFGIDVNMDGIYEYGLKTTGMHAGGLFANPTWTTSSDFPMSSPSRIVGGTLLDMQPLVYRQLEIIENGYPTWVIEGQFDWSCLESPTGSFGLHWTMDCGNDMLNLQVHPTPEPSSVLLLAPGLAALWGYTRRRKRSLR